MVSILDADYLNEVNEAYNDNYFVKTEDIARCPKEGCDFAGFIELKSCRANIKCGKCEFEWRDHAHLTVFEKVAKSVKEVMRFNSESLNYFNEVMSSNPCPQCNMKIYKVDGCAHMVCQKCKYEFCWICMGHYPSYVHSEQTFCGMRMAMFVTLIVFAVLMTFSYSLYADTYVSHLQRAFLRGVGKFVIANLYGLSIFLNLGFALSYSQKVNGGYYGDCESCKLYTLAILVMTYPMAWLGLMYYFYTSQLLGFIPTFLFYEVAGLFIGIVGILCLFLGGCALYFLAFLPLRYLFRKALNIRSVLRWPFNSAPKVKAN
jgi:hypothetical protein